MSRLILSGAASACLLLLAACSQTAGVREPPTHTVRKGETLYAIAWRYQLNYHDLSRWNTIPSPYTIYPGQEILLQSADPAAASSAQETSLLRLPRPPSLPVESAPAPPGVTPEVTRPPVPGSAKPAVRAEREVSARPPSAWLWPTEGKVVKQFDSRKKRSLGVDIAGREGQQVRATAGGRVVYSGSGIPSYGRLIIVKHDAAFLSAYAHNRKLLVSEGAEVSAGQVIAEMGRNDEDRQVLHFEIRKHGKPVNPLLYLGK